MRQQRAQHVGVGVGRARGPGVDQSGRAGAGDEFGTVDQIAVVPQGDSGAGGGVTEDRLGVLPRRLAAGGVPAVPDGDVAFHRGQRLLVEDLTDQAEILEHQHLRPVRDGDAGGFLPAVLQRVEAVVRHLGDFFAGGPDPEYTTLFTGRILVRYWLLDGHGAAAPQGTDGDSVKSTETLGVAANCSRVLRRDTPDFCSSAAPRSAKCRIRHSAAQCDGLARAARDPAARSSSA